MKTIRYKTAKIRLRYTTDPNEPQLEGKIIAGLGLQVTKMKVTTPHPVWVGAVLSRDHFAVLEVA